MKTNDKVVILAVPITNNNVSTKHTSTHVVFFNGRSWHNSLRDAAEYSLEKARELRKQIPPFKDYMSTTSPKDLIAEVSSAIVRLFRIGKRFYKI